MTKEELKFIKKIYDNSFYPATYNIEKNCLEYPEFPNIFYFYNNEQYKEALKKSKSMLEITIYEKTNT